MGILTSSARSDRQKAEVVLHVAKFGYRFNHNIFRDELHVLDREPHARVFFCMQLNLGAICRVSYLPSRLQILTTFHVLNHIFNHFEQTRRTCKLSQSQSITKMHLDVVACADVLDVYTSFYLTLF